MKHVSRKEQREFNKDIVAFVVKGLHTLSIVQEPAFVSIFPRFGVDVMSRFTLRRKIETTYNQCVKTLIKTYRGVEYICLTADIWSSKKKSFIGVTSHYLAKDYTRRSDLLAIRFFPGKHDYKAIGSALEDILNSYEISSRQIVAVVTDNGSNFVKCFREFGVDMKVINSQLDETGCIRTLIKLYLMTTTRQMKSNAIVIRQANLTR